MTMGYAVVTPDCNLNLDGLDVDPAVSFDASNIQLGMRSLLASLAMHWRSRIPAQSDGRGSPVCCPKFMQRLWNKNVFWPDSISRNALWFVDPRVRESRPSP